MVPKEYNKRHNKRHHKEYNENIIIMEQTNSIKP